MFGGLNPKKMQQAMKQMGISQEEIDALKVTIEKSNGKKIVIENPSVVKMKIQGSEMFQVSGETREEDFSLISGEDIKTIMQKTGCSEKQAREVLEKTGDLAEAILELSQ
jgi:nascent polypeptide-associated complex subunit alpha